MKNHYPRFYQSWLYKAVGLKMEQETIPDDYIEPLYLLNRSWLNEEFDQDKTQWNTQQVMRAYTLYYMTMNMPKMWFILKRNPKFLNDYFDSREEVSLTEFGCGPGTFIWAFLFYLFIESPENLKKITKIKACDTSPQALSMAKQLWQGLKSRPGFQQIDIEFIESDWQNQAESVSCDWVIFGNALVEDQKADLEKLRLIECDVLTVIEPGTSAHFKELRKVRDDFAGRGWQIQFPCAQSTSKCPMKEGDWCHFHINRFQLPFIQHISNRAGRLNPRHNFSAFLISMNKWRDESSNDWRLLSQTRKAGRSHIRFICNGESVQEPVLNRKDRNDCNSVFGRLNRGDLLEWCRTGKSLQRISPKDEIREKRL